MLKVNLNQPEPKPIKKQFKQSQEQPTLQTERSPDPVSEMHAHKQQQASKMKKEISRMLKRNAKSQKRELKKLRERC